ncbi:MAG: hypothetical protein KC635_23355, partial [Myxococcales bacterium]|nr:hypothetical protein [Myxococcales bacterium]
VHGSRDKTLHQPRVRDPFAQPDPFGEASGHAAGATTVEGLPTTTGRARPAGATSPVADEALPESIGALLNRAIPRPAAAPTKTPTFTSMAFDEAFAFRGASLRVTGRVVDGGGRPVRDGTVQVLLLRDGRAVALLGTALLAGDGGYVADVRIPEAQPLGTYDLVAEFLGNAQMAPSTSD